MQPITAANVDQMVQLYTLPGHSGNIQDIALSPDGTLLACQRYDGEILLWKLDDLSSVTVLRVGDRYLL